jgi:hypothetical protein
MEEHQKEKILGVLQESIPLGLEVIPAGPLPPLDPLQARAVLPLNWTKHCRLAKSEFRVVYRWAQQGEVTLYSAGVVAHLPYKPGNPAFASGRILGRSFRLACQPRTPKPFSSAATVTFVAGLRRTRSSEPGCPESRGS